MALIKITTSEGALRAKDHTRIAAEIGRLTYGAEGFGGIPLAAELTWVLVESLPRQALLRAAGAPAAPLYSVEVTTLAGALNGEAKRSLAQAITQVLLEQEGAALEPQNAMRVWVRFFDVTDGDLVIGGQATSWAGLRELMAKAA